MTDVDSLVGVVLDGRYRIDAEIGAGGMGTVYRAMQLNVERPVAVKVLSAELSRAGSQGAARFEREARTIARLTHPHVLRLIDVGRTEHGLMYIVTELIQGEPLSKILERGQLSSRRTTKILHQICAAMEDFHGAGIVHRDLKPANLIVDQVNGDDFVRVLDFGIARDDAGPGLTASNMLLGTPAYMSPEQSRGENATPASDLYSLGIIAYECLSGRPPFFGEAPLGILLKQVSEKPPPLTAPAPADLVRLVMALLEKRPGDRPASPAEVRRRLERIEEGHTHAGEAAATPQALYLAGPTPRPSLTVAPLPARRGRGKLALLVLVLAAWGSILALWLPGSRDPAEDDAPPVDAAAQPSLAPPAVATSSIAPVTIEREPPRMSRPRAGRPDGEITVVPLLSSGSTPIVDVFVDGVSRGRGPSVTLKLSPGPHVIEVVDRDGARTSRRVRVKKGESRRETFILD